MNLGAFFTALVFVSSFVSGRLARTVVTALPGMAAHARTAGAMPPESPGLEGAPSAPASTA